MKKSSLVFVVLLILCNFAYAASFPTKNISFRNSPMGGTHFIGEVTNDSGHNYEMATFKLSIYSESGALLEVLDVVVPSFNKGQTKSFNADSLEPIEGIAKVKLQFETGI